MRPRPYSASSTEIIRRKLQRPRPPIPTTYNDKYTVRPYTTYGGGEEYENLSSTTPLTEKRQSDKTINDSLSVSDRRPSLDTSPSIPQGPVRPICLTIGRQRPASSSMVQRTTSPIYGSPKPDRECANLSKRPYSHSGFSNEHPTLRGKEKLPFLDKSTRTNGDDTYSLVNNPLLSDRSIHITEIHPMESNLNSKADGQETQERRTTILGSKSRLPTVGVISLDQRPSTSPSHFNGSSTPRNLQLQNQQYNAARHSISTVSGSSAPNDANQNKSQLANDQTEHRNWTSVERDSRKDATTSEPNNYWLFNSHTSSVAMGSNSAMREFEYSASPTSDT